MAARAEETTFQVGDAKQQPLIKLQNPVSSHFAAFIVGNAQYCEKVVEEGSAKGQHIIICGAGPSLAEEAAKYCPKGDQVWGCNSAGPWLYKNGYNPTHFFTVDQTPAMLAEWKLAPDIEYMLASTVHPHLVELLHMRGRNNITWFHNYVGIPPDSICDDCGLVGDYRSTSCVQCQGGNLTRRHGPVAYSVCFDCGETGDYKAETCAKCQSTNVQSNAMEYETWLYSALYPATVMAGAGLNTVSRAIDVAFYMGAEKVTVLGADCALRIKSPRPANVKDGSPEHFKWLAEQTIMHADGGSALASGASPLTISAIIDEGTPNAKVRRGKGRHWETKVDLIVTAVWLMQLERKLKGRLEIVGDTLVKALRKKNNAFISRLPTLMATNGTEITCK